METLNNNKLYTYIIAVAGPVAYLGNLGKGGIMGSKPSHPCYRKNAEKVGITSERVVRKGVGLIRLQSPEDM